MTAITAAFGLAVLAVAGAALQEPIVEWWYRHERVPVVRTWTQLLRQDPIDLGGGVKVRVGIEAKRCPAGSGVLLYCLAENYDPFREDMMADRLGPLWVSVEWEGLAAQREEMHQVMRLRRGLYPDDATLWFAKAIPMERTGSARVSVKRTDGDELRYVNLEGTSEPFHPWVDLGAGKGLVGLQRPGGREEIVPVGYVSNAAGHRALPRWDGVKPLAPGGKSGDAAKSRSGPLPSYVPETPDPGFRLKASDENVLTVSSEQKFYSVRPRDHFLARWWINGTPYNPSGGPTLVEIGGSRRWHAPILANRLELHLDFDPVRIGARPGDRIELQLLYCPQGWTYTGPALRKMLGPDEPIAEPRVRMTNRVELRN